MYIKSLQNERVDLYTQKISISMHTIFFQAEREGGAVKQSEFQVSKQPFANNMQLETSILHTIELSYIRKGHACIQPSTNK